MIYTKQEVIEASKAYFNNDDLAANVFASKYALKDQNGNFLELSPADMHQRMAKEFARIEANYSNPMSEDEIYQLFKNFKYIIPQGSPMAGIGNDYQIMSLSNCFVVGNKYDSYGGIMRIDEEIAQIYKRRGGCGIDISHFRPVGVIANGSVLQSDAGATLYMDRYSNTTREVAQNGRRGALILTMHIKHPDVERFIDKKLVEGKVTGANISVKITDEFMEKVKGNEDFIQTFPIDLNIDLLDVSQLKYDEITKFNKGYVKKIKSKKIWDKIIKNAWKCAEPGVLFWDTILRESPADCYKEFETISCNPCAELPLSQYDSCRLIAINLFSYVQKPFGSDSYFDIELFKQHVNKAQRLCDDLIDLEIEKIDKIICKIHDDPEPEYIKRVELNLWERVKWSAINGRRTGLGITGEGDMLAALGIKYGSPMSMTTCEKIHKIMAAESYRSSIQMAKERGCFPIWDYTKEENNIFINRVMASTIDEEGSCMLSDWMIYGRRNIGNLTSAPAGSISTLSQTTSGIEPLFAISYKRRRKIDDKNKAVFIDSTGDAWEEYNVFHDKFKMWFDKNWYKLEVSWFDKDHKPNLEDLSPEQLNKVFEKSPYFQSTAQDINWVDKVKLQGKVQQFIDHSISATTNLPYHTTLEMVEDVYMAAWRSGCKGHTIYRDGSRDGVLITNEKKQEQFKQTDSMKRPKEVPCDVFFPIIKKVKYIVMVGLIENKPYEVFAFKVNGFSIDETIVKGYLQKIKSGQYNLISESKNVIVEDIVSKFEVPEEEFCARLISTSLRHGTPINYIVEQLNKSHGTLVDFSKVIARQLKKYIHDGQKTSENCIKCESKLVFENGCLICKNCGYSKCG